MTPGCQEVLKVTHQLRKKSILNNHVALSGLLGEAVPQRLRDLEFMCGRRMRRSSGRCKEGVNM